MAKETKKSIEKQAALDYHEFPRAGKLEIRATKPMANGRDLSRAYSPGVAEACLEIEKNPDDARRYTSRGNLVAVISNGTAVLGLGDIGALASKPVMEGKAVLFKKFAGIDCFDISKHGPREDDDYQFVMAVKEKLGLNNLEIIKKRLTGWQLESFNESYEHKINNGISLFKKSLKNG